MTVPWTYVTGDLNGKEIYGAFYRKELQKIIKKGLELKKQSRKKVITYMLNGKTMEICFKVELIKKAQYK